MSNVIQNLNAENEWVFLKTEIFENKPDVIPYPAKVVRVREILLRLEVLLAAFENEEDAERKKEFQEKYLQSKNAYLQLAYKK